MRIFIDHLNRVCEICRKYDFIPMIWDDVAATLIKTDSGIDPKKFDQPKGMDTDVGKRLVWGDVLLNSCRIFDKEYAQILQKAAEDIQPFIDQNDNQKTHYEYAQASRKAYIVTNLREAYLNGDTEFLENMCTNIIPELKEIYKQLELKHRTLWLNTYKPFGYQKIGARYGAQIMRLDYAYDRLKDYLAKKVDTLPELDEAPIRCEGDSNMAFFTEDGTVYVDYEKYTSARYLIDVAL